MDLLATWMTGMVAGVDFIGLLLARAERLHAAREEGLEHGLGRRPSVEGPQRPNLKSED